MATNIFGRSGEKCCQYCQLYFFPSIYVNRLPMQLNMYGNNIGTLAEIISQKYTRSCVLLLVLIGIQCVLID